MTSKEGYSIEVTPEASRLIAKRCEAHGNRTVRLFVKLGACGTRSFCVAMEERLETDEIFTIDGLRYIIDKVVLKLVHPVKVDTDGYALRISGSGLPSRTACGTCCFRCGDDIRCPGDCETCPHKCVFGVRRLKALGKGSV